MKATSGKLTTEMSQTQRALLDLLVFVVFAGVRKVMNWAIGETQDNANNINNES